VGVALCHPASRSPSYASRSWYATAPIRAVAYHDLLAWPGTCRAIAMPGDTEQLLRSHPPRFTTHRVPRGLPAGREALIAFAPRPQRRRPPTAPHHKSRRPHDGRSRSAFHGEIRARVCLRHPRRRTGPHRPRFTSRLAHCGRAARAPRSSREEQQSAPRPAASPTSPHRRVGQGVSWIVRLGGRPVRLARPLASTDASTAAPAIRRPVARTAPSGRDGRTVTRPAGTSG